MWWVTYTKLYELVANLLSLTEYCVITPTNAICYYTPGCSILLRPAGVHTAPLNTFPVDDMVFTYNTYNQTIKKM